LLQQSAQNHGPHAEVVSNLSRINFFALVLKDRAARHHLQLRQLRKAVDDAFRNAVREVIGVWITVLIVERQHGNRFFGKTTRHGPVGFVSRWFRRLAISRFRAFDSFRCQFKCPCENQCNRKSEREQHDHQPDRPIRNLEKGKDLRRDLHEQPRNHRVRDRNLVNVATLQPGKEVPQIHFLLLVRSDLLRT